MDRHSEFRLTTILVLLERRRALDMKEPDRTLLDTMVNEVMDAHADTACGGGTAYGYYRQRRLTTPSATSCCAPPKPRAGTCSPEGLGLRRTNLASPAKDPHAL